jgi:FixJ family two-component response regulator
MKPSPLLRLKNTLALMALMIQNALLPTFMPGGMTGMDLQDRLIADGYRRPIIFMSALSAEDAGATAASRFLRKPFSDERLIDCLDQALKDPCQIAGDPEQYYVGLERSAHY